jgi:hypothetical protein
MKFIPTAHRLARAFAPTILVVAISACGGSDTDPLTDYLGQAEVASITVRPGGLLAAGPGSNLIANGSFDAPGGSASGWSQKSGWTRFDAGGNVIGPILYSRQSPPGAGAAPQVARFCGYPYNKQTFRPDGTIENNAVSCGDRLTSDAFVIPAGTTRLSLRVDALGQFQCVGTWQTIVALLPVSGGPRVPAIYIRPSTPDFQQNTWQTLSFEVPADRIAQMAGQSYQVVSVGQSGSCTDPEMENSFVMLTGFNLTAN